MANLWAYYGRQISYWARPDILWTAVLHSRLTEQRLYSNMPWKLRNAFDLFDTRDAIANSVILVRIYMCKYRTMVILIITAD